MPPDSPPPSDPEKPANAPPPPPPPDPKLLEILVCPLTKTSLRYDAAAQELLSPAAGLAYPIRDGIPIMLPEEARRYDPDPPPGAKPARAFANRDIGRKPGDDPAT